MRERLTLTTRDQQRVEVLTRWIAGILTTGEAVAPRLRSDRKDHAGTSTSSRTVEQAFVTSTFWRHECRTLGNSSSSATVSPGLLDPDAHVYTVTEKSESKIDTVPSVIA
jgi:hypothetical protein